MSPPGRLNRIRCSTCSRIGLYFLFLVPPLLLLPATAFSGHVFPAGGGVVVSSSHTALVTIGETFTGRVANSLNNAETGLHYTQVCRPPTGYLPPVSLIVGDVSDAIISAQLDETVVDAFLRYRLGGVGPYSIAAPMTEAPPGSNIWQATLPASAVTSAGIQYYVEADNGTCPGFIPFGAPEIRVASPAIVIPSTKVFSLMPETFSLAGVPFQPTNPDPTAVFNELGTYDDNNWRYGTYDANHPDDYREPPEAEHAIPGQGFWVISRDEVEIYASGTTTPLDRDFTMPLAHGWNQIANPYDFDVPLANVILSADVLPQGADPDFVGYTSTGYVHFQDPLRAGKGYWLWNEGSSDEILEFVLLGNRKCTKLNSRPGLPSLAANSEDWSILVQVTAGDSQDGQNVFGMRREGTSGLDSYDYRDAPSPPAKYVSISFLTEEGLRLLTDFRGTNQTGESWEIVLDSDLVGEYYQVIFEPQSALPPGWSVVVLSAETLQEVDVTHTHQLSGRITSKHFRTKWIILAGSRGYVEAGREDIQGEFTRNHDRISLEPAFPNPFESNIGTVLSLVVPRRTQGNLKIFDLRGRLVRTIATGALEAGVLRFSWFGRDDEGSRVASGIYFARLTGSDFQQTRKLVVLR